MSVRLMRPCRAADGFVQRYPSAAGGEARSVLDRLAMDYTHLFHTSADRFLPYEGIQTGKSDRLMGAAAHSIRVLSMAGYLVLLESGEVPDHISVELAFMSEFAHREAEAAQAGDPETAEYAASLQRRFWTSIWAAGLGASRRKSRAPLAPRSIAAWRHCWPISSQRSTRACRCNATPCRTRRSAAPVPVDAVGHNIACDPSRAQPSVRNA